MTDFIWVSSGFPGGGRKGEKGKAKGNPFGLGREWSENAHSQTNSVLQNVSYSDLTWTPEWHLC